MNCVRTIKRSGCPTLRPVLLGLAVFIITLHTLFAYCPSYISDIRGGTTAAPNILLQGLEDRLRTAENISIASHEDAFESNKVTCPKDWQTQIFDRDGDWQQISSETVRVKRQNVIDAVREHYSLPESILGGEDLLQNEMYGRGRGLVFAGGNGDTLLRLRASLRILRYRHNCYLSVEIFVYPEEIEESQNSAVLAELRSLRGVTIRTLRSGSKNYSEKNVWIKADAILASSFSELLYLDSDNIPLADPTFLFDHEVYKRHGVVFWPDLFKDGPGNPIWRMLGIPCTLRNYQLDSGQILIDKRGQDGLNLAALVAASAMQKDYAFWFQISMGDKDTFRYSMYLLGLSYSTPEHWLSAFGYTYPKNGNLVCSLAMLQYSLSPSDWAQFPSVHPSTADLTTHAPPLFVHTNVVKQWGNRDKRPEFTTLKRLRNDKVDQDTSHFRPGFTNSPDSACFDIWDAFDDMSPREGGTRENGDVITERLDDAFGGVLASFNDMFWTEGGLAGSS